MSAGSKVSIPALDPGLLAALADIHRPESVPWWPPAPGWWLLLGLVLVSMSLVALLWWRRRALRREALAELGTIRSRFLEERDCRRLAMELNMLLRRVALARFQRESVAGLTGERWLAFLDRGAEAPGFAGGVGRVLITASYGGADPVDSAALLGLAERWIRQHT